jgi:hypothetical protein
LILSSLALTIPAPTASLVLVGGAIAMTRRRR